MFLHPLRTKCILTLAYGSSGDNYSYRLNDGGLWENVPPGTPGHSHGIELGVAYGTPVHAISNGMIIGTGWENPTDHTQGLGRRIRQLISYPGYDSFTILYGFLSEALVVPGDKVIAGDRIGYSGDSGASGGSKLRLVLSNIQGQFKEPKFRE